jgi:hypothetical protein
VSSARFAYYDRRVSCPTRPVLPHRGLLFGFASSGDVRRLEKVPTGLDIPKAPPADVARATLDGVERGEEEIFPDPMSRLLADGWRAGVAKELERQNATMVLAEWRITRTLRSAPAGLQPFRAPTLGMSGPAHDPKRGRGPDRPPYARTLPLTTRAAGCPTRADVKRFLRNRGGV